MGSTGDEGRDEGRMKLVFWCSTRDKTVNWVLGVQRDKVRSVGSPPGFPAGVACVLARGGTLQFPAPGRQSLRGKG